MPLYDYACPACTTEFDAFRPMSDAAKPSPCPACGSAAPRRISAPRLAGLSKAALAAHATNERASHEPHRSSHVCGPGCSHGGGSKGFSAVAEKPAMKTFPAKRPWMFSH